MSFGKKSGFCLAFCLLVLFGIVIDMEQARRAVERADRGQKSPLLPHKHFLWPSCGNNYLSMASAGGTVRSMLSLPILPYHVLPLGVL